MTAPQSRVPTRTVHTLPPEGPEPRADEKIVTIEDLIASTEARRRLTPFLRPGTTIERLQRKVDGACQENPDLKKCERWSIVDAVAKIEEWGLEIGETAYLVPFNVKVSKKGEQDRWQMRCRAIVGYKGIVQRIREIPDVRDIDAHIVYDCELDSFRLTQGTTTTLYHQIAAIRPAGSKMVGAYAIVYLPFNRSHVLYMTIEEIETIRATYSKQWKNGLMPPWYPLKSVCRQLAKLFSTRADFRKVNRMLDDEDRQEAPEIEETPEAAPAQTEPEQVRAEQDRAAERGDEEPNYENEPFPEDLGIQDRRPVRSAIQD